LERAEALALAQPPARGPQTCPADEARELAREVAAAFGELVGDYREHWKLSAQDAVDRAGTSDQAAIERALTCPPDQVSWSDLNAIESRDPAAAVARWDEIRGAARGEIRSGHRAARSLESASSTCWGRARSLAIIAELSEAWQPRDALEQMLVDQMAVYQAQVWEWQWTFCMYADLADLRERPPPRRQNEREPFRVTALVSMDKAAAMVDRFQDLFLRTLRALQGRPGPVVVRRANQVNVAQQQMNIAE
jgi:hypothetical protein